MNHHPEQIAEQLKQTGLVAIVRGNFSTERLLDISSALLAGEVTVMELTLNSRDALPAMHALRGHAGNQMLIGAGTVRSAKQARAACDAGAQFIVSPHFDAAIGSACQALRVLHMPGVFTPTEAQTACAAGFRLLKLFPADLGGPAYLKALRAPLDDIEFMPTGGISAANVGDYRRAGAALVGVGSALVAGPQKSLDELETCARELRAAWNQASRG